VEAILDGNEVYMLVAAVIVSVGVTLHRFGPGIPMSVDTTSHLYKILFLQHWWKQGVFPFWSPDWYAGSPALLLYPPLGYYLAAGLSMVGIEPVLSYKVVDAAFYWVAPISVYFLGKELGFSKGESALGALLFSVVPEVIENYIFFDRFPTVIAIPIFCAFIITFHRALLNRGGQINLLSPILTWSALMLTHHLSALIAGIAAALMVILTFEKEGFKRPLLKLVAVGVGTLGVTAFWLVPFLMYFGLFSANQFFNRNVTFPFLRFTYFGFDVASYLLGIAQFILAAVAVQSIIGRTFGKRIPVSATIFFPILLGGMAVFQTGEIVNNRALSYVGELVVAASFLVFLGQFVIVRSVRNLLSRRNGTLLAVLWFVVFLWFGLGYFALPILQLRYISTIWTKTMDVYRIWLYLALPMGLLAARGLHRSASKLLSWKPLAVIVLLGLAVTPITVSVGLKMDYAFNHQVNLVLPYSTANAEIPHAIIDYFRNDSSPGRILAVNAPFWIYVLPNYVDKPIVDGWYPQTKLVTKLVEINDYRLDDLETAPNDTARFNTWRNLISQAGVLGVTWVMVGDNGTLANMLMENTNFTERLSVSYGRVDLVVYKALEVPSLVETCGPNEGVKAVTRPNPDRIEVSFDTVQRATKIVVKEAYFPTWAATTDGQSLPVARDSKTGYILLTVPAGTNQLTLYQKPQPGIWSVVSIISLLVCIGLGVVLLAKKERR
jgi:uncharacterized membrane protein